MYIKELWRYPVKSMRGERLQTAELLKTGIRGDRQVVVISESRGRVITARTHPGLLGLQGSISGTGEPTINDLPWNSFEALALVQTAASERVRLVDAGTHTNRFDVLPLLVSTDGAVAATQVDMRRLRPNIVLGGVPGHEESMWSGMHLASGSVNIAVAQRRMRCVMTTYDPDTLKQDLGVLRRIVAETGGELALDCSVQGTGTLTEGDGVALAF